MTVYVGVVQIAVLRQGVTAQVRVDVGFADFLLWDMDHKLLVFLVPEDVGHGLKFLPLIHIAAEEGDDLAQQEHGDEGQGRGKPGPDLRKFHNVVFGDDEFAQLTLAQLVDPAVPGGHDADGLIRRPGLL